MIKMWINDLNIGQFILLMIAGYLVGTVIISSIILFIADVIGVVKRKIKG